MNRDWFALLVAGAAMAMGATAAFGETIAGYMLLVAGVVSLLRSILRVLRAMFDLEEE